MTVSAVTLALPPPMQVDKLTQSLSLPALPVSPLAVATPVPEGGGKEDKGKGKAADKKGKKVLLLYILTTQ